VVALLLPFLATCGDTTPDPGAGPPAAAPRVARPTFDGARALELVEAQVAFGPRIPGSAGHAAQLDWMVDLLDRHADTVEVDTFEHSTRAGERLTLHNVLARFNAGAERRLLFLAHWDTRPRSDNARDPDLRDVPVPGANDGASGTAVLLELARLMGERPPDVGVELLFTDGEDYGPLSDDMFLGAKRFAATLPGGYRPVYAVLLDMVGDADPRFPVEGYSAERAPEVVQRVWRVAQRLGYGQYFPMEVGQALGDDHIPLNDAGIPTVDVIDFTYGGPSNPFWHTPDDVPAAVSARTLGMVGEVVAEIIYQGG
jgi:hypothetical protein